MSSGKMYSLIGRRGDACTATNSFVRHRTGNLPNEVVWSVAVGQTGYDRPVYDLKSDGSVEIKRANTVNKFVGTDGYGNLKNYNLGSGLTFAGADIVVDSTIARLADTQTFAGVNTFTTRAVVSGAIPILHLLRTLFADTGAALIVDGSYVKLCKITDAGTVGDPLWWVSTVGGGLFLGVEGLNFAQLVTSGFSSTYKSVKMGHFSSNRSIAFGYDVSTNTSGNFNGQDYFFASNKHWLFPTNANNNYRHFMHAGTDDHIYMGHRGAYNNWCVDLTPSGTVRGFHFGGWTGTPTITKQAGAGAGATVSLAGNDTAGTITVTTSAADTPPGGTSIFSVAFASAYEAAPYVLLVPSNVAAMELIPPSRGPVVVMPGTLGFNVQTGLNPLPPTTAATYTWNYHVIQ